MGQRVLSRRAFIGGAATVAAGVAATWLGLSLRPKEGGERGMVTLYTFGDSILDCGHYNQKGVHPGALLVRNDDALFPEFKGKDLSSRGLARLEHRARDGATVSGLPSQARGIQAPSGERAIAILTVGGNDLLTGLITDTGPGVQRFAQALEDFVMSLPIRPFYIGNVYDPSFGSDQNNFLGVDPKLARENHRRVNDAIANVASKYGALVDLHAHFLKGDPSWFTHTIEPSLTGASEVRRAFLPCVLS